MDQKLHVVLSAEVEGHTFSFSMPIGCKVGTAYNAVFEILQHVANMAKENADKAKMPESEPTAN